MSPRLRPSRTIRARIAKRDADRIAKQITIDRRGLSIDGKRFRHYIAEDVEIDQLINDGFSVVRVGIYAEHVEVRQPLPRHARITHTTL